MRSVDISLKNDQKSVISWAQLISHLSKWQISTFRSNKI